jgi:hypothetical protein
MKFNHTLFGLFLFIQCFSQNSDNQEKIKNSIQKYFLCDREIIHVQFNKNIYVNSEIIAFKGYVFSKNNNSPNLNTTNVQLVIYNEQNEIIQKQLLYTTKGTFEGGLLLNEKYIAGKYRFHFYTNWMNNFYEDDSFIETIQIINKKDPYNFKSAEPNYKTAKVTFYPESGLIINRISNRIGVKIIDCNLKGISIEKGIILDSKSNEVASFSTNKMGNGNFYFIPNSNESYILKYNSEKFDISEELPKSQETGLTISYNNNLSNNKLAISIKTNSSGIELLLNKKFILLIHQNGNAIQKEFSFSKNEPEQILFFDKKYLSNGINSIRLLDENLNEIAERLLYNFGMTTTQTTIEAKIIENDSVALLGKINTKMINMSISVLPAENISLGTTKSILGTFYLNAFLEKPENETYSYFDLQNKNKKQDLELLLLNQKRSKYLWNNIKSNPPNKTFIDAKGVAVSGKVANKLTDNSKYRIQLISLKDKVFEEADLDKNNEFKYNNFFAQDSTEFILQLINDKNKVLNSKLFSRISRYENPFRLSLNNEINTCPPNIIKENNFTFSDSNNKSIKLEEVIVFNKYKKEKLTYDKEANSIMANSFKIGDNEFGSVMDFISRNGFRIGINEEDNTPFVRNSRNTAFSISSAPPSIYLDNEMLLDFDFLYSLPITDVDEIYIDRSGFSDTAGRSGSIKIFLKKGIKTDIINYKFSKLFVNNGYAKNIDYKISEFITQKEFSYFGTLNWTPNTTLKENEIFQVKFPKGNQTEIQVLIEGFSEDGQLISEIKKIPVTSL